MSEHDLPASIQREIIEDFRTAPDVFEKVYNHYYEMIFRYLSKRCMSSSIAYDITADTFLKAFNSFHKFKWKGISIKVWIYRIATNELKNHYRKPKIDFIDDVENMQLATGAKQELNEIDDSLLNDQKLHELNSAIAALNPKYQKLLSLYYFTGLSQAEIAEVMGRSVSGVKSMMHRAISQLRKKMITPENQ